MSKAQISIRSGDSGEWESVGEGEMKVDAEFVYSLLLGMVPGTVERTKRGVEATVVWTFTPGGFQGEVIDSTARAVDEGADSVAPG